MAYANGQVPTTALANIGPGTQLVKPAANAYKTLALLGHMFGWTIKPAAGVGSGYRNLALEALFYKASHGDKAAIDATQLSGSSIIRVAAPGYSSHGWGDRLDLVFNGSDHPTSGQIALANHCGWTREFGEDDPNHFMHNGRTAINGPGDADWIRILAHYFNGRHLGQTTTAEKDGIVDKTGKVQQHYTWLVQAAGIKDGIYPSPPYLHDGKWGPKTNATDKHYRMLLWNAA